MVSCPVQENFQKISVCWHPPHAAFFLRRADHRSNMVKFNEFLRSSHCDRPSQAPSPFADAGRATLSHPGRQAPRPSYRASPATTLHCAALFSLQIGNANAVEHLDGFVFHEKPGVFSKHDQLRLGTTSHDHSGARDSELIPNPCSPRSNSLGPH